ncbi:MAG: 3-methyl-2-oxobutanoate hydroxymethyltransferase, partial [Thauera sp.]
FNIATHFYYNTPRRPFFTPRWLLTPMVAAKQLLCHFQGKEPFERLWMLDYVDQQLVADSSRTRSQLGWKTTPRKAITRRLVFLIENMKKNPDLWRSWNEAMLVRSGDRPHLVLHDLLGVFPGKTARFVRNFMDGAASIEEAVARYVAAVKDGSFPAAEHCY